MILYSVTVNIDRSVEKEWVNWMKIKHIPDVLNTGLFESYKMYRLLNEEENGGMTYSIQYLTATIENINKYLNEFAPKLMAEHNAKYKDKHVAFRTVLESVE
ncbi:DUF4286 family protein [Fulvivirgaceae bacterium BMA10]|uniref:DUF4286 family protein n=1 Tax=Splendidivirga corallicola TaxID=3051826 RepID=A0ABT8KVV9_9BACT|nr:DUF4286 family protein [Fulvivirgaceae bacterium BMA10]